LVTSVQRCSNSAHTCDSPTSERGASTIALMRWGLIPHWSSVMPTVCLFNARSETAATLPAFRDPIKFRRCLIPADGFYEWRRERSARQPFCFEINEGEMFSFAGLWENWKDPKGEWIRSCTVLTTTPNPVASRVHDRMPVILDRCDY